VARRDPVHGLVVGVLHLRPAAGQVLGQHQSVEVLGHAGGTQQVGDARGEKDLVTAIRLKERKRPHGVACDEEFLPRAIPDQHREAASEAGDDPLPTRPVGLEDQLCVIRSFACTSDLRDLAAVVEPAVEDDLAGSVGRGFGCRAIEYLEVDRAGAALTVSPARIERRKPMSRTLVGPRGGLARCLSRAQGCEPGPLPPGSRSGRPPRW
jgi:hypothetical protein